MTPSAAERAMRPLPLRLVLATLALCIACFAYVLVRWPDNFFADDSYFYFQVAWNFAHGHGSTFNGLMPTNGYHPLWMLVCAAIYTVVKSKDTAVHAVGAVIAVLNLGTLAGVTLLLRRAGVTLPFIAWLLLMPFLFTSQLGTEGALSAACLTATLLAVVRLAYQPTRGSAFAYALLATLTVLSRLDNIFIVTALSLALASLPAEQKAGAADRPRLPRLLLMAAPLALLLWGVYLWSNHHYFGTWQPISGVLKSHSHGEHRLGSNLPHIALFDLAVLAVGLPVLWRWQRDRFLRVVELPVAAGVLCHALYIVFRMSSETRWSWYYTTWTLLASIVLARSGSVLLQRALGERRLLPLRTPVLGTCVVMLLVLAARNLHRHGHEDAAAREPGFQAHVVDGAHLSTLLAFDKPGRIAYYSTARIIPLDGLMGDLRFQQDLGRLGIAALVQRYHVDGFIGPPHPLSAAGKQEFCDVIFLSATHFVCTLAADGRYEVQAAEIYARLSGTAAGTLPLPPSNLVWNAPGYVAVWRVAP